MTEQTTKPTFIPAAELKAAIAGREAAELVHFDNIVRAAVAEKMADALDERRAPEEFRAYFNSENIEYDPQVVYERYCESSLLNDLQAELAAQGYIFRLRSIQHGILYTEFSFATPDTDEAAAA
ncbi:MAG: hypothetical protein WAX89_05810 [Alphaproteobacteria bacterium]